MNHLLPARFQSAAGILPGLPSERILSHIRQQDGNITLVQRVTPDCGGCLLSLIPYEPGESLQDVMKKKPAPFLPRDFSAGFQVIPETKGLTGRSSAFGQFC